MAKYSIELPNEIKVPVSDTGLFTVVPVKEIATNHPDVIRFAALAGFMGALNNISRGKDEKTGRPNSDDTFAATRDKRVKPWLAGSWASTERAESQFTQWREVYIADCVTAGMTVSAAESAIKAKVAERLGKDTKATFANFIEASAIEYAEGGEMDRDQAREALENYYASEAERRAKELAEAGEKVKPPVIDLAKFKKA